MNQHVESVLQVSTMSQWGESVWRVSAELGRLPLSGINAKHLSFG